MNKIERKFLFEELDATIEFLSTGRNYHGSERHSNEWHDGWESAANYTLTTLKMIKLLLKEQNNANLSL